MAPTVIVARTIKDYPPISLSTTTSSRDDHLAHWEARGGLNELLEKMQCYTQQLVAENAQLKAG